MYIKSMKSISDIQSDMAAFVRKSIVAGEGILSRRQFSGGYRSIGVNMHGMAIITQFSYKWESIYSDPQIPVEQLDITDLAFIIKEIEYQQSRQILPG